MICLFRFQKLSVTNDHFHLLPFRPGDSLLRKKGGKYTTVPVHDAASQLKLTFFFGLPKAISFRECAEHRNR